MGDTLVLSTLPKTWVFDLDGTLLKHSGYKIDGVDTVLPGALEYLVTIPLEDKIVIFMSYVNFFTGNENSYRKSLKA